MSQWKPSEEHIKNIRLRQLGKKHSEETKRKQGLNQIGLRLGWKHSEKTKDKIKATLRMRFWKNKASLAYTIFDIMTHEPITLLLLMDVHKRKYKTDHKKEDYRTAIVRLIRLGLITRHKGKPTVFIKNSIIL